MTVMHSGITAGGGRTSHAFTSISVSKVLFAGGSLGA